VATYHLAVLSVAGSQQKTIAVGSPYATARVDGGAPLLKIDQMSLAPERYLKGPEVSIDLDPKAPGITFLGRGGAEGELGQEVLVGPIGCSVRWSGGRRRVARSRSRARRWRRADGLLVGQPERAALRRHRPELVADRGHGVGEGRAHGRRGPRF